jgi:hypothetical protein
MKRILIVAALFVLGTGITSRAADANSTNALVWCGLDYSMVKMIGKDDFRQPYNIFPEMLVTWNWLFLKEFLPKLESKLPIKSGGEFIYFLNEKANASQIIREDGTREEMVTPSHITEADIAKTVQSYDLKDNQGIGLVFIMDRLVRAQEVGCLYIVFFDVSSRKVLYSERVIAKAGGAGFRNYWFNPIKIAADQVPKMYRKAKRAKANG